MKHSTVSEIHEKLLKEQEYIEFVEDLMKRRLMDLLMGELGQDDIIVRLGNVKRERDFRLPDYVMLRQDMFTEKLVRCKDCIHWRKPGSPCSFGILTFNASPPYGFCHLGERQEDGKTD